MKKNKLHEIIENSNIKFENDEQKNAFIKAIDEEYVNGIVANDEKEFAEQKEKLQETIKALKSEFETSTKTVKDLQTKFDKIDSENKTLKDRAIATKIVGDLSDEQFEDLMLLTNAKMAKDKKLSKEEVMKNIAETRGFIVQKEKDGKGKSIPASKQHFNDEGDKEDSIDTPMSSEDQFKHFLKHS